MIFLAVQKLLSLVRYHLFIFVFIFVILGDSAEKNIAMIFVSVLPMFSCKSFVLLGL